MMAVFSKPRTLMKIDPLLFRHNYIGLGGEVTAYRSLLQSNTAPTISLPYSRPFKNMLDFGMLSPNLAFTTNAPF
jgi:hypothetical protein